MAGGLRNCKLQSLDACILVSSVSQMGQALHARLHLLVQQGYVPSVRIRPRLTF